MRLSAFVSVAFALFMFAAPARAITNQDVLSMASDQRYAYIAASVEMVAFMASVAGNRERSQCIVEWFFRSEGGAATVVQAMNHNLERTPQALIYLLINRQCGRPAAAGQ